MVAASHKRMGCAKGSRLWIHILAVAHSGSAPYTAPQVRPSSAPGTLFISEAWFSYGSWYHEPGNTETERLDIVFCVTSEQAFSSDTPARDISNIAAICPWHSDVFDDFIDFQSSYLYARTGQREEVRSNSNSGDNLVPVPALVDRPFFVANGSEPWVGTAYDVGRDGNAGALTVIRNRNREIEYIYDNYDNTNPQLEILEVPFQTSNLPAGQASELFFDSTSSNLRLYINLTFVPNGCTRDADCTEAAVCSNSTSLCECLPGLLPVDDTGGADATLECRDPPPPLISLLGDSPTLLEAGVDTTWIDLGVDVTSVWELELIATQGRAAVAEALDTKTVGNYTVTYSVTDVFGYAAVPVNRTVWVRDTTPPEVTLLGNSTVNIEAGIDTGFVDAGAFAVDIVDGVVAAQKNQAQATQLQNFIHTFIGF